MNMDLIAGLPGDTAQGFADSLGQVLSWQPENITVHTLALKKGSRIMLERAELPSPDTVGDMLDFAMDTLRSNAYAPYYLYRQKYMSGGYENVGWAKPGQANLYNICIMEELCSILAMGGGASTKLVDGKGHIERIFAPKYPKEYIERIDDVCKAKSRIEQMINST